MRFAEVFDKTLHEQRNVFAAFAHRRQVDRNNIQPVIKIFTEGAVLYHLLEIGAGGGNDSDVDLYGAVSAHALKLAFLQDAQQFHLKSDRHVPDFIQENRSGIRLFEQADSRLDRAGECAFYVAE